MTVKRESLSGYLKRAIDADGDEYLFLLPPAALSSTTHDLSIAPLSSTLQHLQSHYAIATIRLAPSHHELGAVKPQSYQGKIVTINPSYTRVLDQYDFYLNDKNTLEYFNIGNFPLLDLLSEHLGQYLDLKITYGITKNEVETTLSSLRSRRHHPSRHHPSHIS